MTTPLRTCLGRPGWWGWTAAGGAVLLGIALSFSTDFIGDDHVFLAWSRYAPSPWVAWFSDVHGGEYYRPVPLLWWWCLGRLGGGHALPFACFMAWGHACAAQLVAKVLRAAGEPTAVARGAAAVFFLAPSQIDAVSWYAASTDLLACLGLLLALLALSPGDGRPGRLRRFAYLGPLAFALCAKESAAVFPLMLVLWAGSKAGRAWGRAALAVAVPSFTLLGSYLLLRRHVLQGWGGAGDPLRSLATRLMAPIWAVLMWLSGTTTTTDPIVAALMGGAVVLFLLVLSRLPQARSWEVSEDNDKQRTSSTSSFLPVSLAALSLLPLLAVSEPTARRYTYLAAFPLSWLAARSLFAQGRRKVGVLALLLLLTSSVVQIAGRAQQIARYREVLHAARSAVGLALSHGHHLVHLAAGIKDLDLAVKEDPALAARRHEVLVLSDVPASFAFLPDEDKRSLLAQPPLPPSGAYRFGPERIVGLARRGDEPTLEEALTHWPDLRLLRPCLAQIPQGVAFCDVTSSLLP